MTEILWHGRGGQGAFTAARLLGAAYVAESDGFYALAFPSFGPERRGAPIRAFTKLSDSPVGDRSQVVRADYSIYLDDTLFTDAAFLFAAQGLYPAFPADAAHMERADFQCADGIRGRAPAADAFFFHNLILQKL